MTDTCPTPEAEQGDIVGRLRDAAGDGRNLPSTCVVTPDLLLDAASEVERLRSELERFEVEELKETHPPGKSDEGEAELELGRLAFRAFFAIEKGEQDEIDRTGDELIDALRNQLHQPHE